MRPVSFAPVHAGELHAARPAAPTDKRWTSESSLCLPSPPPITHISASVSAHAACPSRGLGRGPSVSSVRHESVATSSATVAAVHSPPTCPPNTTTSEPSRTAVWPERGGGASTVGIDSKAATTARAIGYQL